MRIRTSRRGFTMADLIGAIATGALLVALALAATRQARQEAMTAAGLNQLRWIAGATSSYAADNGDRFWTFSWRAGELPHSDPTLPSAVVSDMLAAGVQAIDILRRRGRPDMEPIPSWLAHFYYSHLPLLDYLDRDVPDLGFVNPADGIRLSWARDPAGFDAGAFLPLQPSPSSAAKRWPYSASYQLPAAFYDQSGFGSRLSPGSTHTLIFAPASGVLEAWLLSDCWFPAQKVHLMDTEQRSLGAGRLYALTPGARAATLRVDGAAGIDAASQANPGWQPNAPTRGPSEFAYAPSPWEAPTTTGEPTEVVQGRYRWTRGSVVRPRLRRAGDRYRPAVVGIRRPPGLGASVRGADGTAPGGAGLQPAGNAIPKLGLPPDGHWL